MAGSSTIDPGDLKYLEEHGVARAVTDEALRGLRYHNRSFGALDLAMQEEKLDPNKESGDEYREAVRMYVETLKECVGTPEEPGVVYEAMHFPGEPIDLSIFESDKEESQENVKETRGIACGRRTNCFNLLPRLILSTCEFISWLLLIEEGLLLNFFRIVHIKFIK